MEFSVADNCSFQESQKAQCYVSDFCYNIDILLYMQITTDFFIFYFLQIGYIKLAKADLTK